LRITNFSIKRIIKKNIGGGVRRRKYATTK
jgi:hypothetical protein